MVFKEPLGEYSVYVLSGIVVWDLVQACVVAGGSSLMMSEQYIRQFNHPKIIYSLKNTLVYMYTFFVEMIALAIWMLFVRPINLVLAIFTLPLTALIYFGIDWAVKTISAYTNTKYRDYPQMMALAMQALYYISPVFLKKEMFLGHEPLEILLNINPITHILNLIRDPFIYGKMPSLVSYCYVLGIMVLFTLIAAHVNKKNEKKIIFYL